MALRVRLLELQHHLLLSYVSRPLERFVWHDSAHSAAPNGRIKVNHLAPHDAFVSVDPNCPDILIPGRQSRGNALHGELVEVQLLPRSSWSPLPDKETQEIPLDESAPDVLQKAAEADGTLAFGETRSFLRSRVRAARWRCAGKVVGKVIEYLSPPEVRDLLKRPNVHPDNCDMAHTERKQKEFRKLEELRKRAGVIELREGPPTSLPRLFKHHQAICVLATSTKGEQNRFDVTAAMRFVMAQPLDPKMPVVKVTVEELKRWEDVPGRLDIGRMYLVDIFRWDPNQSLPLGRLLDIVGFQGDAEAEVEMQLVSLGLTNHAKPHGEALEAEAASVVREAERQKNETISKRIDLRGLRRVFTIDPSTARDLDDAIHISPIVHQRSCPKAKDQQQEFEIGIHIADVAHYVALNSHMDLEARERCATLYTPYMCFPMLPRALADDACSLHPGGAKMTMSVVIRIREDGSLSPDFQPLFFQSVIESCCRFNYDEVQVLIDGGDIPQENRPKITSTVLGQARWNNTLLRCSCCTGRCVRGAQGGWETPTNDAQGVEGSDDGTTVCSTMEGKVESASDALIPAGGAMTSQQEQRADAAPCCQCCERQFALSSPETPCPQTCSVTSWDNLVHDLQLLDRLTSKIRARRDAEEFLSEAEVSFTLDESLKPVDIFCKRNGRSHHMIEEMMLLANKMVASLIRNSEFKSVGVLRCHPAWEQKSLVGLEKSLKKQGIQADFRTMASASRTIKCVEEKLGPGMRVWVVEQLLNQLLLATYETADYSGRPCHFGLGFQDYTHFTSPIRRYPDLLTHRVLLALIEGDGDSLLSHDEVKLICEHCNGRQLTFLTFGQNVTSVFRNIFFHRQSSLLQSAGVVTKVKDKLIEVYLPSYGARAVSKVLCLGELKKQLCLLHQPRWYRFSLGTPVTRKWQAHVYQMLQKVFYETLEKGVPHTVKALLDQPTGEKVSETSAVFTWSAADGKPSQKLHTNVRNDQIAGSNITVLVVPLNTVPTSFGLALCRPPEGEEKGGDLLKS